MSTPTYMTACEDALRAHRQRNAERQVFPQINLIIDEMLKRRSELVEVYAEIYDKLGGDKDALYILFDAVLHISDQ